MQPDLPRPLELTAPQWWVVSEARIANPCIKRLQDDGSMKRPKTCLQEDRENPDWPEGYTYLDRFLDEMRKQNLKNKYGVVTMCVGTGQGAAGIFEFIA